MTARQQPAPTSPEALEARLAQAARGFAYPPTPDLSRAVTRRMLDSRSESRLPRESRPRRARLALAGALVAILLAVILAVPPVRAAVIEWIRIGAVRIFLVQPTPTPVPPTPTEAASPSGAAGPIITATPRATPAPTATPLGSVLDLSGETTLADARRYAGFDIRLPAGLGPPDRVYYQNIDGPLVILVWLDPANPDSVRHALFETSEERIIFMKITPKRIAETTVNGDPAVWLESPYMIITRGGTMDITRLIATGHTLVWTRGPITYRLETGLSLEEAVKLAESIQ